MKCVTLDALIIREDFEISDDFNNGIARNKSTISIEDLRYDSFFFSALRKPDFQRETNEWEPEKVYSIIESFLNGELVPAIILWKNEKGYIFVIDGAHRLSSLGAWINDDYGDGEISRKYFSNYIPDEQRKIGEYTRELIDRRVGSFQDIMNSIKNKGELDEKRLKIVNSLGSLAIQLQWVEGDAKTAEESFLKINQSATKISDAELELIKNRTLAHAMSARAIMRAGRGHNYWSVFDDDEQKIIIENAKKIHSLLFTDGYFNKDDIGSYPIGGPLSATYALDIVTQTVMITNKISNINSKNNEGTAKNVLTCLKRTLKILEYLNSKEPCSLGLHPFVYFYSDIGKHKIGSFYGMLELLSEMIDDPKMLNNFISVRAKFESILLDYSFLVQQINRRWRQSKKAYDKISNYYRCLIEIISSHTNESNENIIKLLRDMEEFKYLQIEIIDNEETSQNKNFSRGKKQQIKINALVQGLPRCAICGGYISIYSSSIDHIIRKSEGGNSNISNGQLTHLYCNTTFKN